MFCFMRVLLSVLWLVFLVVSKAMAAEPDFCGLLPQISDADPDKDPRLGIMSREEICRAYYWLEFKAAPAEQLFKPLSLKVYKDALKQQNCATALRILRDTFADTYRSAPSILTNDSVYKSWHDHIIGIRYPNLALCLECKLLATLEQKIKRQELKVVPYRGWRISLMPQAIAQISDPILKRHMIIYGWELRLQRMGHLGTALALLRLSSQGQALKYHPETETYLAQKLKLGGYSDPAIDKILASHHPIEDSSKNKWIVKDKDFQDIFRYTN